MTFLNPAVLIGLAASLIPVILHFINFRKIKKIEFSSLRFLKKLEKNKIRNLKIKQWLLLFIRLLLIVFLVLAFSRPALQNTAVIGEDAPKTVVVILDNSYSMSIENNGISNFALSKKYATEIFNNCKPYDKTYLILTSPVTKVTGKNIFTALNKQTTGFVKGNLNVAFNKALKIINKTNTLLKQIIVFSDFQKSNLDSKSLQTLGNALSENSQIKFVLFNFPQSKNIAINNLKLENQILLPGKNVDFLVSAINTSQKNSVSKTISLYLNNEKTAQKNLTFTPLKKIETDLFTPIKKAGLNEVQITSEDDAIKSDNSRYTAIFVKNKINILITAYNKDEAEFLLSALSPKVSELNNVKFINSQKLTNTNTEKYDILFAVGGIDKKIISSFTESGKFVVLFPSEKSNNNLDNALTQLKLSKTKVKTSKINIEFDKISFNIPLIKDLFGKENNVRIASPEIKKYLLIKPLKLCNKIITLEDNSPFLCSFKYKKGEIFLFAVPPTINWSDFPIKPFFAALMNRFAMLSASHKSIAEDLLVGETYYLDFSKVNSPEVKIVTPEKREYYISSDFSSNNRHIKFNKTFTPGFYRVYSGTNLIDVFTVNVDTKESAENFYTANELKKIVNSKIKIANGNALSDKFITFNSRGTELWRLFLILAMIMALAEMHVAKTNKKDLTEINQEIRNTI